MLFRSTYIYRKVNNGCNNYFLLPPESIWQEYELNKWGPGPRRRRTAKGRSISTRIPTEMDEEENELKSRKKMWN